MTVCHLNFKSVLWYIPFFWPVILSVHGSMSFCREKFRETREGLGSLLACPPLFNLLPIHFSPHSTTIYHTLAYFAYATIVGSTFLVHLAAGVAYLTDR